MRLGDKLHTLEGDLYICCRYEGIILKSRSDLILLCISSTFISTVFESSQYSALAIGVEIDAFEDF